MKRAKNCNAAATLIQVAHQIR